MSFFSWAFVLILVVGIPIQSLRGADLMARLPRAAIYLNMGLTMWCLTLLGWAVVAFDGDGPAGARVAPPRGGTTAWVAACLAVTGFGLGLFVLTRVAVRWGLWPRESATLARLRPQRRAEWVLACLLVVPTAGICAEFLFRGVVLTRLESLTGSLPAALVLTSVAFGLSHVYQGWPGATLAALIGAALAWPVLSLGSLYPSMLAHALIDLLALIAWPLLEAPDPREA